MKIVESRFHVYTLPYTRRVRWFNSAEDHGTFALLHLLSDDGAAGVAEAVIKPTWSGVSPRSLRAVVDDLLLPALREVDIADPAAVGLALSRFPENHLAKMLVDNACWVMRAAAAGRPLWDILGGSRDVEISWCVTRRPPEQMADEAAEIVQRHGFRALKIKGGQGVETDLSALRRIRAAVGSGIALYVDANGAYTTEEAPAYVRAIADEGTLVAEDPCPLRPDDTLRALVAGSPIPILVDLPCASVRDATLFMERGARSLSVKPGRIGFTEARRIADLARSWDANVCSGMYAESMLGTLISLQLSAALKGPLVPAEQSFFLMMQEQIMTWPLVISDGRARLPDTADYAALVDWERVAHHAIGGARS